MALNRDDLTALSTSGYGPLTLSGSGSSYTAGVGGAEARIDISGPAVRVTATSPAEFPDPGSRPDAATRAELALARLVLERRELVELEGDPTAGTVHATVWLDRADADAHDLALAVRDATILAALGAQAVGDVRLSLMSDEQMRREAEAVAEQIERDTRLLEGPTSVDAPSPAAAPRSERPPTPAAPVAAPTQPRSPAPESPSVQVSAPTALLDHDRRTIGNLAPGVWYRVTSETGGWITVVDQSGVGGWIPAASVSRRI